MISFRGRCAGAVLVFAAPMVVAARPAAAQGPAPVAQAVAPAFDSTDVLIPMRDGVAAHQVFVPGGRRPLPCCCPHTVRDRRGRGDLRLVRRLAPRDSIRLQASAPLLVRGVVRRRGRPGTKRDVRAVDEGSDTYNDRVLLKHTPGNNAGRMLGLLSGLAP